MGGEVLGDGWLIGYLLGDYCLSEWWRAKYRDMKGYKLGDYCLGEGWEAKYWEMDGYVLEINVEIREMSD